MRDGRACGRWRAPTEACPPAPRGAGFWLMQRGWRRVVVSLSKLQLEPPYWSAQLRGTAPAYAHKLPVTWSAVARCVYTPARMITNFKRRFCAKVGGTRRIYGKLESW